MASLLGFSSKKGKLFSSFRLVPQFKERVCSMSKLLKNNFIEICLYSEMKVYRKGTGQQNVGKSE
jgi:hypothetical protein